MCSRVSAKIKIETTPEIIQTVRIYHKGLQHCVNIAWEKHIKNNVKLHPFVYQHLRSIGLQSQLSIACIKQACGMVKKAKNKPVIEKVSVGYNFPRSASIKNNILSISTINGRQKFNIIIPECFKEYFNKWSVKESLLQIDKEGRTFFIFTFAKEVNVRLNSGTHIRVLGIDLGINKLAVTNDCKFYGKKIKGLRKKRDKLVSKLQSKGTRASKRKLKKLSGKWKRFMTWTNHNISKEIIDGIGTGNVVVMEDLKGIRKTARYNKWVHKWAFYQLQTFIEYKAVKKGNRVVRINPAYTSKDCSRCGSRHTKRNSGFFHCLNCGFHLDSDLNASRNISQRYRRNMGLALVNEPILTCDDATASIGSRSVV